MAALDSAEQRFYLQHFRGRSLVLGHRPEGAADQSVDAGIDLLVGEGVRIIRLLAGGDGPPVRDEAFLGQSWGTLRANGRLDLRVGAADPWREAVDLAVRLRPFKLVLIGDDVRSGPDEPPPFVTLGHGQPTLDVGEVGHLASQALAGGVGSVNACRPVDLLEELLTYRGAGLLFTDTAYCTVQRLGLDDYESAHRLIQQGVEEGFLLPRSDGATARLLVDGYGARFGDDHLAGFAALLTGPYRGSGLAEVSALTTISRFSGGGVGSMLVRGMVEDAAAAGLNGVFACTTSAEAVGFFTALGFAPVDHDRIPDTKWAGYDPARQHRITALLHPLGPTA